MNRYIFCSLLFTAHLSLGVNAQPNDKYLVSIMLDPSCDRDRLEALGLPIYHRFENSLVAGVSAKNLEALRAAGIPFTVVDEAPWSERYFLLSTRRGDIETSQLAAARVLAADRSEAFIKSRSIEDLHLDRSVYSCVEVVPLSSSFRNERVIQPYRYHPMSDSLITSVISEVSADSVRYFIKSLQDFRTRYCLALNRDSVSNWIRQQFLAMGYADVVIDSFQYQNTWQKNVVATLPGTSTQERIIVIGGHHDSFSSGDRMTYAPGADDNASGTVAALEIARAMKRRGYRPEVTIKFMTFAAEEAGLLGSRALAQRAKATGANIILMINHDMISYTSRPVQTSTADVNYYTGFEHLRDAAMGIVNRYTALTSRGGRANSSGSDSYSFWSNGFPAIYFLSTEFSPYYHSPSDVISNYNMQYCTEVIKASCAMAMYYSSVLQGVRNVTIADMGDGASLLVRWSKNPEPELSGYKIGVGRSTGKYDTVLTTPDTSFVVRNLTEGMRYFIGVSAFDVRGNESFVTERSGVPYLKPQTPSNFAAEPQWHRIMLRWTPNKESDLAGYNIYRVPSPSDPLTRLNSVPLKDTTFLDTNTENGRYYYYSVTAVDNTQNESIRTTSLRSRAVSLDQGILVADETKGGDGSPLKPTDAQVDGFYSAVLAGFKTQVLDVEAEGRASLADLGAFSTVVWHGNDLSSTGIAFNSQQDLQKYLGYGGKLLISSYRPTTAFGNNTSYPKDFVPGDFLFDYLKIQHAENRFLAKFLGAGPLVADYSPVYVDTAKTLASTNYHLTTIESIVAAPGASDIYKYETNYDTTQIEGKMKGQPVGVEYLGPNFKVVVLSFPLYYMDFDAARNLVRLVLMSKFAEPTATAEQPSTPPAGFELLQNYPNPFNPITHIGFRIADRGSVSLKVYDVLGRDIATLVNEQKDPGEYAAAFNASALPSGIYFYRLQLGSFVETKKMLLIK